MKERIKTFWGRALAILAAAGFIALVLLVLVIFFFILTRQALLIPPWFTPVDFVRHLFPSIH